MLEYRQFRTINLEDQFFKSLKSDYSEFGSWFARKAGEFAYVFYDDNDLIDGFLYLKLEDGAVEDVVPPLPPKTRLKVGTFKVNAHGTRLGERFIKKIFDHATYDGVNEIYVTIFPHHTGLTDLLQRYGFEHVANKTSGDGVEHVLRRVIRGNYAGPVLSYPIVPLGLTNAYLLSIQPQWHTRLLPDSILKNEGMDVIEDVSHTNSIHKVYMANMSGMENLRPGDALLIYRTTDGQGPAHYRSVATSVCVMEEYRHIDSFGDYSEFLNTASHTASSRRKNFLNFGDKENTRMLSASRIILHLENVLRAAL